MLLGAGAAAASVSRHSASSAMAAAWRGAALIDGGGIVVLAMAVPFQLGQPLIVSSPLRSSVEERLESEKARGTSVTKLNY